MVTGSSESVGSGVKGDGERDSGAAVDVEDIVGALLANDDCDGSR